MRPEDIVYTEQWKRLKNHALEVATKYPRLTGQINDLMELARDEIEEKGSLDHETDLVWGSIDELVEDED